MIKIIKNGDNLMDKKKVKRPQLTFSGIQPTSIPHIGNYFGAIKHWVEIQKKNEANKKNAIDDSLLISIVDLHALTAPKEAKLLK